MRQIITHFTDDDLYKFTMCCAVIENYPRTQVKYKFIDRDNIVYPAGFADELRKQIVMLENVVITDEEIAFMRCKCTYIPSWFYSFLKGFRYDRNWVEVSQDERGYLSVEFNGYWSDTILLEVKVLAIISEMYYMMTGEDKAFDYGEYYRKSWQKAERLLNAGCVFSDFGTRRRASFEAQETAVKAMKDCQDRMDGKGRFVGTSNVYLAMKYGLTPVGTMGHELICAIAGMYGPQMANHIAMEVWTKTYRGALGTFLYDTYGWRIFSLNFSEDFARMFKGLRVDSDGLNVDNAIGIQQYATGKCQPSFGIGTYFTNDFPGVKPKNIVIKLVAVKITESWPFYSRTCKLSNEKDKYTGDNDVIRRFMEILHIDNQEVI